LKTIVAISIWHLCAGRIGQLVNLSSLGNDIGLTHTAVREWLTLLETSYVAFLLEPFHRNIGKRLIKTPKLYFYDVGLAAYLMGIKQSSHLHTHPGALDSHCFIEHDSHCLRHLRQAGFTKQLNNCIYYVRFGLVGHVGLLFLELGVQDKENRFGPPPQGEESMLLVFLAS
jgi:Domain of unknown function (DUF4143)